LLDLATVRRALDESKALGVREYYFTGGEPFLNPALTDMLVLALQYGPATVLTNGTVLRDEWLDRLAEAEAESPYSLEFRVSIDGFTAEENDPVRGAGTFDRAMAGLRRLLAVGFLPIVTVTRTREDEDDLRLVEGFLAVLRAQGYARPRLKLLPTLRIGAEVKRVRGYRDDERVSVEMMEGYDRGRLICDHSRVVTDRGVYVCPILLDAPDARLGATLSEALGPYALAHQACYTCWQHGAICANPSGGLTRP
jgi:MoaA/NifB/PqqE/SkfB family radical SAM enzyme